MHFEFSVRISAESQAVQSPPPLAAHPDRLKRHTGRPRANFSLLEHRFKSRLIVRIVSLLYNPGSLSSGTDRLPKNLRSPERKESALSLRRPCAVRTGSAPGSVGYETHFIHTHTLASHAQAMGVGQTTRAPVLFLHHRIRDAVPVRSGNLVCFALLGADQ